MAHHRSWPMRRPLSDDERRLIRALLPTADGGGEGDVDEELSHGLDGVEVVGQCACGCPTIDLAVRGAPPRPVAGSRIIARAEATTSAGVPVGVILWGRDGSLSCLEVHPWDATTSFGLPLPDTITHLHH